MCKKNGEEMTLGEMLKEYAHLKDTQKGIEAKIKKIGVNIKEKMGDKREIEMDGYKAVLMAKTRDTLKKELVEVVLKVKVTDDCYTHCQYDELRVKAV